MATRTPTPILTPTATYTPALGDENWDSRFGALGLDGPTNAVALSGNDVYVGGTFTLAGTTSANNIARWNSLSGQWSALGAGVDGVVNAIAVSGNDVYVGGDVATAGGTPVNGIARWNGATWSALGSGVSFNFGRILTACGVLAAGWITAALHENYGRAGSYTMLIYAVGMIFILFAPDTTKRSA